MILNIIYKSFNHTLYSYVNEILKKMPRIPETETFACFHVKESKYDRDIVWRENIRFIDFSYASSTFKHILASADSIYNLLML